MKYGGFPGQYHQTSPCYCYQHDIPRRYTPVAVSCLLHFTSLWTLICVLRLDCHKLLACNHISHCLWWAYELSCRSWNEKSWLKNGIVRAQPQAWFGGVDHVSGSPSVHLFFVLPSIDYRCGRKESTRPSLRRLHNYSSSLAPARPPLFRQSICPTITAPAHAAHPRDPRTSTSPRTLSLRWPKSLVLCYVKLVACITWSDVQCLFASPLVLCSLLKLKLVDDSHNHET